MTLLICPQCHARYQLNREIPANATFQCRKCQHKFKAVAQPEVPPTAPPAPPVAPRPIPIQAPPVVPVAAASASMPPVSAPIAEPPVVQGALPPVFAPAAFDAAEPEAEDIFGIHSPAPVAAGSVAPTTAAPAANAPAAPLSIAERRAQQKRKNKILLFACCGCLLLLVAGGGTYLLLRDSKTPVSKNNVEGSKEKSTDAKQPAVAEKTSATKKSDEGKDAAAIEPLPEPMPAPMAGAVPVTAPATVKEIKARMITLRMQQPMLHGHLATDGSMAVVANAKGEVDGYALTKAAHLWSFEDPIGIGMPWKISAVAFSTASSTTTQQSLVMVSGNLLAEDLFLVSLDAKDGKEVGQYRSIKGPASFMEFHPLKPNLLLVGLNNATGSMQLLNLNEDKPVAELLEAHESAIVGMAISADGTRCITTSSKKIEGKEQPGSVLTIWSLADVGREREYTEFAGTASALAISPDGKLVAVHESVAETGTIHVLSFPELEPVAKIPGAAAMVPAGQQLHAFLPADDALAVVVEQDVAIFNARTGEKRASVPKLYTDKPYALLIAADGKTILTSSGGKEFKTAKLP